MNTQIPFIKHLLSFTDKILVATGYRDKGTATKTELIDLSTASNKQCELGDYPIEVYKATGGLVKQRPVICGGYPATSDCYTLKQGTWQFLSSMSEKRKGASSAVLNDRLWVAGGKDDGGNTLKSTEYIHPNGAVTTGPPLPEPLSGHCIVKLNSTTVLLTGSYTSSMRDTTLYFNAETSQFDNGPRMLHGRFNHGCAVYNSPLHGNRPVAIVAGGSADSKAEVLDFTLDNPSWESSKYTNSSF